MFTSLSLIFSFLLSAVSIHAAPVRRAPSSTDILVFQFAGVLELLETDFYTQALAKFKSSDFTDAGFANVDVPIEIFQGILNDESTHSSVIESAIKSLGAEPLTTCTFDFGNALQDVKTMAATARVVENVGVSAYLGGANLLSDKELLIAAATILTVEARHQALLNVLNDATAIPSSFDMALQPDQVLAIAGKFISGCDLGIPPLPSLAVTNNGTIAPGTQLTFSSTGIPANTTGLTCQMLVGGATAAIALPFDACIVPQINGPVYIFISNSTLGQPLLSDITTQFAGSIVAGPLLTFIDSIPQTLGEVATGGSASSSSSTVDDSATASTTTITPAQATALVQSSDALSNSTVASTTTITPAQATALVQDAATLSSSTDTSVSNSTTLADSTGSVPQPTASVAAAAIKVLGMSVD
ncbi:hypothetical protein FRB96_007559 [Tulasnella sp. 330]|nr:hypothetical protein FRB96_007559 [Tulasnella sp. 330]KAG8887980.1 hypothetical protein FRB98_008653 [Tulasnella sp. 332]